MSNLELWDLYDSSGRFTGETITANGIIPNGRYHLVGAAWIKNNKGEYLISQRHPQKNNYPLFWECTGGSALSGETSLQGAIREVKEELGICLNAFGAVQIYKTRRDDMRDFYEAWLFRSNVEIKSLKLQETEVVDAKWVPFQELKAMYIAGRVHPFLNYLDILDKVR